MDPTSLVGLLLGLAAVALGQHLEGGAVSALLQPTAAVIVLGGTAGATLLSLPAADLRLGLALLPDAFRRPRARERELAVRLTQLAQIARKNGIVALEEHVHGEGDPFLRSALQRVVDVTPSALLQEILRTEIDQRFERARAGIRLYETAGGYSPTLGIVGAVLGLIHVMENLDEPSQLGAGIAVAFVATVYGIGLANLVLLPIAARLRRMAALERGCQEMVMEGALAIEGGNPAHVVEERLLAFLPSE